MATTRIIPMHIGKGKSIAQSIRDRTDYVKNPDKTQQGEFISAYECDIATIDVEFLLLKNQYHHKTGRRQNRKNDVLAYQIRQAFKPGEITPEEANRIGYELALSWTKQNYPFDLLIDIQEKIKAGKGAGYEHWAKIFNLKQAAKTLSFLMENKLTDYETLEEKAKQLVSDFNTLSAQMKQAEKRMQEISDLKKHIYQYAKTKEVYVAYRKAGYSKKFYAENEEKIRLHKAAKVAFSALNTEKLPTIKELSKEYEKLLTEKKNLYSDYRKKKKEMQEILTVKSNVDRLLFPPQKEQAERENER